MENLQRNQMSLKNDAAEFVGKMVVNPYGWTIGRVIGVSTNPANSSSLLGVDDGKGGFTKYDASKAHFVHDNVVIGDSWRTSIEALTTRVAQVTKKLAALDEIGKDAEYSDICNTMRAKFEEEKTALLEERRSLAEQLKDRLKVVDTQLKETYEFAAYVKIDHITEAISEDVYQKSNAQLQLMIEKLLTEKDDIKMALDAISNNLSTLPPEPLKNLMPAKPSQQSTAPIRLRISEGQSA
jgi:hypothetical protein